MYEAHFNLTRKPFENTPDSAFFYANPDHEEALSSLVYAVTERKGFVLLTGEVGTGKTTLCRKLLGSLGPEYHTALILNPMLTGTQLLRAVLEEFGLECTARDRLRYLTLLNQFLLEVKLSGRDAVLIIDEAQDMSIELLEMTRLLSNLETDSHKLLQIVLVGQPELRQKLRSPRLRQLDQRITVRYHLRPMSLAETGHYIQHRIRVAGGEGLLHFDDSAVEEVYRHSGGTPRLINAIGDKALLAGYVRGTGRIDRELVDMAVRELKEAA